MFRPQILTGKALQWWCIRHARHVRARREARTLSLKGKCGCRDDFLAAGGKEDLYSTEKAYVALTGQRHPLLPRG